MKKNYCLISRIAFFLLCLMILAPRLCSVYAAEDTEEQGSEVTSSEEAPSGSEDEDPTGAEGSGEHGNSDTGEETESTTESEPGSGTESGSEEDSGSSSEKEPESSSQKESESTSESESESKSESESESKSESESESGSESEASGESGSESESESETAPPPTEPEECVVDESRGDYGPDIYGDTYCVIDGETGEVLLSCRKDQRMYPASCTKVMTALLVLENVENLDDTLTFTPTAINIDPSSSTLNPKAMIGETMTVRDALYGMLLQSANECGAMLGEYVAGTEEAFAAMMNARAAEIGCVNTHFMNAYGIHHPEHYTTAYDLALILREAMLNEKYRALNATVSYTIPATNFNAPRTFMIGHAMINGSFPVPEEYQIIGGKTGSTPQAGRCLTTAAVKDGFYTVSALMKSTRENYYNDEMVLLEFVCGLHEHTIAPVEWLPVHDHVTATDGLRIRFSPSINGAVDYTCNVGDTFERLGIYGDWSKVLVNGHTRYLATEYLSSDDPEHVPVTEAYVYVEPTTAPPETETETPASSSESTGKTEEKESSTIIDITETHILPADDGNKETGKLPELFWVMIPSAVILLAVASWVVLFVRRRKKLKE